MSESATDEEPAFPFEVGDTVLVRVREDGKRGRIIVKFEAECVEITNRTDRGIVGRTPNARFEMPFGVFNSVTIRPYEAEFEVL